MQSRGSSIDGAELTEKDLDHPDLLTTGKLSVFVPLGAVDNGSASPQERASVMEQGRLMAENAKVRISGS